MGKAELELGGSVSLAGPETVGVKIGTWLKF